MSSRFAASRQGGTRRPARILVWPFALLTLTSAVWAQTAGERLQQLIDSDWQYRLREFPELAASTGAEDSGRYGEVTLAAWQRRLQTLKTTQTALAELPVAELSRADSVNYRILREQIDNSIADIELGTIYLPFNADTQFWADYARVGEDVVLKDGKAAEIYVRKLSGIAVLIDEYIVLMAQGLKLGYSIPQAVLLGRDAAVAAQVGIRAVDSGFYAPLRQLPDSITAAEQKQWRARAESVIEKQVLPAYARLLKFLREQYFVQARTSLAATALPNGEAFYRAQVRQYTTLAYEPEKIHEIGLQEVARIRAEMEAIRAEVKFAGDLPAFLNHMRSDPQFFAKSAHELLAEAAYFSKRIDGKLPQYFNTLPRQPYGVAPVPDNIAPTYTAGRYVGASEPGKAGFYWVNTSKLDSRPLWALPALTLHEAVPGHHLQSALALEQGGQPPFRRYNYISAYGEGWALYAEHLGVEMGIYETPYQQFGRLVYEMWRACRLVVDTGIHSQNWSREQAVAYMQANTALSLHEINTEVDRYISWPGQALSYKLGEIKIRELRRYAEAQLGEKFDLRGFHDRVLSLGSVPLSVLDEEIRIWIGTQQGAPSNNKRMVIATP